MEAHALDSIHDYETLNPRRRNDNYDNYTRPVVGAEGGDPPPAFDNFAYVDLPQKVAIGDAGHPQAPGPVIEPDMTVGYSRMPDRSPVSTVSGSVALRENRKQMCNKRCRATVFVVVCVGVLAVFGVGLTFFILERQETSSKINSPSAQQQRQQQQQQQQKQQNEKFTGCEVEPFSRTDSAATPWKSGEKVPTAKVFSCTRFSPKSDYEIHAISLNKNEIPKVTVSVYGNVPGVNNVLLVLLSDMKTSWNVVSPNATIVRIIKCNRDSVNSDNLDTDIDSYQCPETEDIASDILRKVVSSYGEIKSYTYTATCEHWTLFVGKKAAPVTPTTPTMKPEVTTTPRPVVETSDVKAVRLSDQWASNTGHVQVLIEQHWYYICDKLVDAADATVICKTLGIGTQAEVLFSSLFQTVDSTPLGLILDCSGSEANITNCRHHLSPTVCTEGVASIKCIPAPTVAPESPSQITDVRLVDSHSKYEGNVQVKYGGMWRYVCDVGWSITDAKIVCNSLGYGNLTSGYSSNSVYGNAPSNNKPIIALNCISSLAHVKDCRYATYWNYYGCDVDDVAGVQCAPDLPVKSVSCNFESGFCGLQTLNQYSSSSFIWTRRRGSTPSSSTGPSRDHTTGTSRGYYVYVEASSGYTGRTADMNTPTILVNGSRTVYNISFWYHGGNMGSLRVHLTTEGRKNIVWVATGNKGSAWRYAEVLKIISSNFTVTFEAVRGNGYMSDIAIDDISIKQQQGSPDIPTQKLQVRLVGGTVPREGRVELYYLGNWGTICDMGWDMSDGRVVCRMLGYSDVIAVYPSARFGQGNGTVWLSNLNCSGQEASLEQCGQPTWFTSCQHYRDASVRCKDSGLDSVECTFEDGMCGYTQSYENNLNWVRNQGSTPTYNTGPSSDHTLANSAGYYIYMSARNGHQNEAARIASPVIKVNRTGTVYNVSFWFHMRGNELGYIKVFAKLLGSEEQLLWNYTTSPGSYLWRGHFIHVSTSSDFQIIFEGTRGGSTASDIALDDIFIYPLQGNNTLVPVTVGVRLVGGFYPWEGKVEVFHAQTWGDVCYSGWDIYDASVVCRMLGYRGAVEAYPYSYSSGNRLMLSNVACLGFEYSLEYCSHSRWGYSYCYRNRAAVRCTPPENANYSTQSSASCSFESGLCGFIFQQGSNYNWTIKTGSTPSVSTGPSSDHTLGTLGGHYIYAEASSVSSLTTTRFVSPPIVPSSTDRIYNVSFWYHMYGSDMGTLNVRIRPYYSWHSVSQNSMWTTRGNLGTLWRRAEILGVSNSSFQVVFEAIRGYGYRSDIALDDVYIVPLHAAPVQRAVCNFEDGTCGFLRDFSTNSWMRSNGSRSFGYYGSSSPDHTLRSTSGHYMYASYSSNTYVARLLSPTLLRGTSYIVSFWYMFPGRSRGSLQVFVQGANPRVSWTNSGYSNTNWRYGYTTVSSPNDLQVVFEASITSSSSYVAIDDIVINIYTGLETTPPSTYYTTSSANNYVRLVNGYLPYEGRVEVYYNGRWGTVCDDGWNINAANVVCRMLGYLNALQAYSSAHFGQGTGTIWLDQVSCTGRESSLWNCRHNAWGTHDCSHSEDAGVRCQGHQTSTTTTFSPLIIPSIICANTSLNQPLPRACAQFVVCAGTPFLASCPGGFWFSKKTRTCEASSQLTFECYPNGVRKPGSGNMTCSSGWSSYQGHCYKFITAATTYMDASTFCHRYNSSLASIHSSGEISFVQSLLSGYNSSLVYVGYDDIWQEGLWQWADGSTGSLGNWARFEYTTYDPTENCAAVLPNDAQRWYDISCRLSLPFVCKG